MKRLFTVSGVVLVSGLGISSYAVRELMAAFVFFSAGFAALLLLTVIFFLALYASRGGARWLRNRAPLWHQAGRVWMASISHSLRKMSKQTKTVRWSDVRQELTASGAETKCEAVQK